MGMFDWFVPSGAPRCPECGSVLAQWQGKDGPCALFVWEQGHAAPVDQPLGEFAIEVAEREQLRLPERFVIYSYDCEQHQPVEAVCACVDGVWSSTEIEGADGTVRPRQGR